MSFNDYIRNLLTQLEIKGEIFARLTRPESMVIYRRAFTHSSVDSKDNYETMEQIGDGIVNSILINYFHEKYPNIDVGIAARLKIKYASKESLAGFAKRLDFQPYISLMIEPNQKQWKSLLEDVFEAFFGATYTILAATNRGAGYLVCSFMMDLIMKEEVIDFSREALFDAKTRLKELFDVHKELGQITYNCKRTDRGVYCEVHRILIDGSNELLGSGISTEAIKINAEQTAAQLALDKLKHLIK